MKTRVSLIAPAMALLLAAGFGLAGCRQGDDTRDTDTIAFKRVKAHSTYRLISSAADYEAASDLSFDCAADMLMPTALFGNDITPLQDSILTAAFDTCGADTGGIIAAAFRRAASEVGFEVADTTVADSSYDGLFTVEGAIESLTDNVLSYAVTVSDYMPRAAHGMYGTRYVNYDIVDGKVFTLADIFTPDGLAKLPAILRRTARSMSQYIGPTDLNAVPSGGNFCISGDNDIVFVYQPYEIASYAQGQIRIPIAAYILSDYFTPYGNKLLMDAE